MTDATAGAGKGMGDLEVDLLEDGTFCCLPLKVLTMRSKGSISCCLYRYMKDDIPSVIFRNPALAASSNLGKSSPLILVKEGLLL